jgi:hypothetical protein
MNPTNKRQDVTIHCLVSATAHLRYSGYIGVTKINTGKTTELGQTSALLALHLPRISQNLTWGSAIIGQTSIP